MTPINVGVYVAAYSGAIAGMTTSGWITDDHPSDYALATAIAGAYAQEFDAVWNNATPINSLEQASITAIVSENFRGRAPGPLADPIFVNPANWTANVSACIAVILEGNTYFASQGIVPSNDGGNPLGPNPTWSIPYWYIDPINGNDSNEGTSPALALKSNAGLIARWGNTTIVPTGPITVEYLGSPPPSDLLSVGALTSNPEVIVTFTCNLNNFQVASCNIESIVNAKTLGTPTSPGAMWQIQTSIDLTELLENGPLLVLDVTQNCVFSIVSVVSGSGVEAVLQISQPMIVSQYGPGNDWAPPAWSTIVQGDNLLICQPPTIQLIKVDDPNECILFSRLTINTDYLTELEGGPVFVECILNSEGNYGASFEGFSFPTLINCSSPFLSFNGDELTIYGGAYSIVVYANHVDLNGDMLILPGESAIYHGSHIFLVRISLMPGADLVMHGNVQAAIDAYHDTTYTPAGIVWGSGDLRTALGGCIALNASSWASAALCKYLLCDGDYTGSSSSYTRYACNSSYEPTTGTWNGGKFLTAVNLDAEITAGGFKNSLGVTYCMGQGGSIWKLYV